LANASRQKRNSIEILRVKDGEADGVHKTNEFSYSFYTFLFINLQGFSIILLKTIAFICLKFALFLLLSL